MSEPLIVDRVGTRSLVARNERGGEVRIGSVGDPDSFTPGELLHLALGGCNLLSGDGTLAEKLGPDFAATAEITAEKSDDGTRYANISVRLVVDFGALDEAARSALADRAERAIEKRCTVGLTLDAGAAQDLEIVPV
jgi:uncharacterized OsmC-like protein